MGVIDDNPYLLSLQFGSYPLLKILSLIKS
jgi:hypothetical protein